MACVVSVADLYATGEGAVQRGIGEMAHIFDEPIREIGIGAFKEV